MQKIIAIANQKGGVGKTTTAVNLSASLAVLEHKTLLIDIDPQSNATSALGFTDNYKGIYECIIDKDKIENCIINTKQKHLDILPSSLDLAGAEVELSTLDNKETILKSILKQFKSKYEYIIIDCAPSLGNLTINALIAANSVLIPVQCEYLALEGLGKLLNTIKMIQQNLNQNLEIEGILMTMYDSRLRLSNQVLDEIKKHFNNLIFKTIIHRNVKLSEAPSFGKPALLYAVDSTGTVNYLKLADEVIIKNKKYKSLNV
ncbi:MAG: ParA family protein [Bacteroidetes bacterium]|nr:ParA family protein [Bacteroidota bacterium]